MPGRDLNLSILGFAAVNSALTVELRDSGDAVVKTGQPFLDGTVRMTALEPGAYQLAVTHPNLALPVIRQPIRILPTGDTSVTVVIDPSKFRNTPIADIPDANLGPVRDRASSVAETTLPLSQKRPGEAIVADDWNGMATGIRDLAQATGELTRLVSPVGHNHPELEDKITEITTNFQTLVETVSASMAELQRQIQTLRLGRMIDAVFDQGSVPGDDPRRLQLINVLVGLATSVSEPPTRYSRDVRNAGVQVSTFLEGLIDEHGGDDAFVNSQPVKQLSTALDLLKTQTSTTYGSEIAHHRLIDRTLGTGGLANVVGGV